MQEEASDRTARNGLHVAGFERLLLRSDQTAKGRELLPDYDGYIGRIRALGDGAAEGGIVEFLVLVEFVAARIACRVEMPDVIYVVAQSSDYVAFSKLSLSRDGSTLYRCKTVQRYAVNNINRYCPLVL